MTTERRLAVMALVHVCAFVCVCTCICVATRTFRPPSTIARDLSHPFAAMYKFHVRYIWFPCSRVLLSLWPRQQHQLQRAAVLRVSLDPFLPLPRSSSPAFPSLCRSIYLRSRILGVHTRIRVCAPARSPLSHPSFLFPLSRDMYGFTQTLHSGGRVQIFSTPCLYVFHASLNSSLLAFFFVCFFFFLHYYLNFEILMQSLI